MTVFEMIFGIVLVSCIAGMYSSKQKSKMHRDRNESEISDLEGRLHKLEDLERRVQVLERVVTDKRYDLKEEIDRL